MPITLCVCPLRMPIIAVCSLHCGLWMSISECHFFVYVPRFMFVCLSLVVTYVCACHRAPRVRRCPKPGLHLYYSGKGHTHIHQRFILCVVHSNQHLHRYKYKHKTVPRTPTHKPLRTLTYTAVTRTLIQAHKHRIHARAGRTGGWQRCRHPRHPVSQVAPPPPLLLLYTYRNHKHTGSNPAHLLHPP